MNYPAFSALRQDCRRRVGVEVRVSVDGVMACTAAPLPRVGAVALT